MNNILPYFLFCAFTLFPPFFSAYFFFYLLFLKNW